MEDTLELAIKDVQASFEELETTEDMRCGSDRRMRVATEFPLEDDQGNIIQSDRRFYEERRKDSLDIDDFSEYLEE